MSNEIIQWVQVASDLTCCPVHPDDPRITEVIVPDLTKENDDDPR